MQNTTDRAVGSLLDALKVIWRDNKDVFLRVEGQRLVDDASNLTGWSPEEVGAVLDFMAYCSKHELYLGECSPATDGISTHVSGWHGTD